METTFKWLLEVRCVKKKTEFRTSSFLQIVTNILGLCSNHQSLEWIGMAPDTTTPLSLSCINLSKLRLMAAVGEKYNTTITEFIQNQNRTNFKC